MECKGEESECLLPLVAAALRCDPGPLLLPSGQTLVDGVAAAVYNVICTS